MRKNSTGYIKIHSDEWVDSGSIYKVIEYSRPNPESSAVRLILEDAKGETVNRVVPFHWIEWIPDGEW